MLKTNKQIKKILFTAIFAVFVIPTLALAGPTGSYGSGSWNGSTGGWGAWGGNSPTYNYSYTPNYSYSQPSTQSFNQQSYTPSYSNFNAGISYLPTQSFLPTYSYVGGGQGGSGQTSNNNRNTNTSSSVSTSSSSASAVATNNNINNVYVYTNPTGNAVVHNPGRILLDGYCTITPSNPRVGQTVTATAYATGGIGNYTYNWSGDVSNLSGASVSFVSYTTGIKNINVTIRSDQEIVTRSCTVNYQNDNTFFGNTYSSYVPTGGSSVNLTPNTGITSGSPISGVFLGDLPATGLSLSFFDYMIATMVIILTAIIAFVYQAKKRLTIENI